MRQACNLVALGHWLSRSQQAGGATVAVARSIAVIGASVADAGASTAAHGAHGTMARPMAVPCSAADPCAPSTSGRGFSAASEAVPHRHHGHPVPADTGGPMAKYLAGVQSNQYRPDPRQELTVQMLQDLYDELQHAGAAHQLASQQRHAARRRPSGLTMVEAVDKGSSGSGSGGGSGSSGSSAASSWWSGLKSMISAAGDDDGDDDGGDGGGGGGESPAVRGLYMYGGVGCGKTMLMDVFVDTAPPHFKALRTHFHDFMLDVHAQLRKHSGDADPLLRVADAIIARTRVLCLDELFVTDVADAMILSRLFGRLWARGLVLVATSNRQPDDLYKGGLQRSLFMPFIKSLKERCRVHDMASATDYRKLAQHQGGLYFTPQIQTLTQQQQQRAGGPMAAPGGPMAGADAELAARFVELTGGASLMPARVDVMMGRVIEVPVAAGRCCLFNFQELCGRPVAAADYLALTSAYHTVALAGVPVFRGANRSEAYRFVTLIDVMYENRTRLVCSAEAPPLDLFSNIITQFDAASKPELTTKPDVVVDDNLGFSKDRTISRLTEMQSLEYLMAHAQHHEPALLMALREELDKKKKQAAEAAPQQWRAAASAAGVGAGRGHAHGLAHGGGKAATAHHRAR